MMLQKGFVPYVYFVHLMFKGQRSTWAKMVVKDLIEFDNTSQHVLHPMIDFDDVMLQTFYIAKFISYTRAVGARFFH